MKNQELHWTPVVGYEGIYEVSSCGKVRSLDRVARSEKRGEQKLRGKMLRPGVASTGYLSVALRQDGKTKTELVHRLVAHAFLGGQSDGYVVDHIDGCRTNNDVGNLRYVTQAVNSRNINKVNAVSGVLGVYPNGANWMAQIRYCGKQVYLGTFSTIEEAAEIRRKFEERVSWRQEGLDHSPRP